MASKVSCVTCDQGIGQFKCEGCSQAFCMKHVAEHRQTLGQHLDEIILGHELFQQPLVIDKNSSDCLMTSIAQWEEKSIEKIRQTARDVREKVNQLGKMYQQTIASRLDQLKGQIKKAREEDDFFETDIQNWLTNLEKLQELKTETLSSNIKEDQALPLIYKIQLISSSSTSAPSPVNNIHPRLQYTNQDGVYVSPKSFLVTPIWFFYSPKNNRWFWTPYKNYEAWVSVDSSIVKSGFYKDNMPALRNVEIIEYLRQYNPIPTNAIIREASNAEDRILRL